MKKNQAKKQQTKENKYTTTGLHDSVGFSGFEGEGFVLPLKDQLVSMEKNGYQIEHTEQGILITPKTKKS